MNRLAPEILVLGTAEWNQPIATNQHYMVRELASGAGTVRFVESLALRSPTFSANDLLRIAGRIRRAVARRPQSGSDPGRPVPDGAEVISPIVAPAGWRAAWPANRSVLRRRVHAWLTCTAPKVLWTYTPVVYSLNADADVTVYHCVDLLGTVPGIDARMISNAERRLASEGAHAIASSVAVRDHLLAQGFRHVTLWENVADTSVFAAALDESTPRNAKKVVFAGNLTATKVDFELLGDLAEAGLDVVLAGPHAEGGGSDTAPFERLVARGARYIGMLTLEALAREIASASVGLIPYVVNDYTLGVSPLKTYEYLAGGVAVVSTPIPGVHMDGADVLVAPRASFLTAVTAAAVTPTPDDLARRTQIAAQHSWVKRGEQARDWLAELVIAEHHA